MNKGIIAKSFDTTKYPYIARCSLGKYYWARAEAYVTRRGIVGQITLHRADGTIQHTETKNGFPNMFQAFVWADNQFDYKNEVFKKVYVDMLLRGTRNFRPL